MRTEFTFTLPRGYVDGQGTVHREGTMRLATARDEIEPLRDAAVRQNEAYLAVLLLARVVTRIGEVTEIKRSMPNGKTDVIKAMGNTKWGDIELKRGVDQDKTLWNWRKMVVDGKLKEARKDCTVTMLDYMGAPVVTYSIVNAWPKKYTGVGLKADSNEVAVEGITLCHEGFEIQ